MNIAMSTVSVIVHPDSTGTTFEVFGVLTGVGVLQPLLDFCIENRTKRRLSWQYKLAHDIRIFLDYVAAQKNPPSGRRLFINFSQQLLTGTFDIETGIDPSWLCWSPRTIDDRNRIVGRLTTFFDWLYPPDGQKNPNQLNPFGQYEALLDEYAFSYRKAAAFLGNTWLRAKSAPHSRSAGLVRGAASGGSEPKEFPDDRFQELIHDGFRVGRRVNHRDAAITTLLHGAGLRVSEPFHLFPTDVTPSISELDSAVVLVRHPTMGIAPASHSRGPGQILRREYLQKEWGLRPRNEISGTKYAGWKEGKHEKLANGDIILRAYWATPELGRLFMYHWTRYLEQIVGLPRLHPYALVNLVPPYGVEYGIKRFQESHAAAVRRIGLVPSKSLGTSAHGHRHSYGQRLRRAGVPRAAIQVAMHHKRIDSQDVYTQPSPEEIQAAIAAALLNVGVRAERAGYE